VASGKKMLSQLNPDRTWVASLPTKADPGQSRPLSHTHSLNLQPTKWFGASEARFAKQASLTLVGFAFRTWESHLPSLDVGAVQLYDLRNPSSCFYTTHPDLRSL